MQLIWTDTYNRSLEYLFTCSHDIYTQTTLKKLRDGIIHYEHLLTANPFMGSIEISLTGMEHEYRNIIIKPYFKVIYRVDGEKIYFIKIWDTRRDPELLRKDFI